MRRNATQLFAVLSTTMLLTSCSGSDGGNDDGHNDNGNNSGGGEIVLGVVNPLSGPVAQASVRIELEFKAAMKLVNDNGGVLGKTLKLSQVDSGTDPEKVKTAAQGLVNSGLNVISGEVVSTVTAGLLDYTVPAGVLVLNAASSSTSLSARNNNGLFIRTIPTVAPESHVMADVVAAAGHKKVAVLAADSDYTMAIANGFREHFATLTCGDAPCTSTIETFDPSLSQEQHNYESEMAAFLAANSPDAIVISSYAIDGASYLLTNAIAGFPGAIYVSETLRKAEATELLSQSVLNRLNGTNAIIVREGPGYEAYNSIYAAVNGEDSGGRESQAFDMILLAALGAEKAGSWDPALMAQAIRDVSGPPGEKYGVDNYAAALAAVKAGMDIDFEGASGALDINAVGDVGASKVEVWRVAGGEFQTVSIVDAASN